MTPLSKKAELVAETAQLVHGQSRLAAAIVAAGWPASQQHLSGVAAGERPLTDSVAKKVAAGIASERERLAAVSARLEEIRKDLLA
ncbi:hypothetical protein V1281_004214 [Nitrobacteraceae bacterium AZCC 2161]